MTPREQEEYIALRATIRERGTARAGVFAVGLFVWSGLVTVLVALALPPVTTLIPLVALAATFEAVLGLHAGVERIGRYLLVFHRDQWEQTAGAFGRPAGALTADPLFAGVFAVAALANLIPLLTTTPIMQELVVVGVAHAAFSVRILMARAAAARQRRVDTARLEQMRAESSSRG